jgi:hypothetical protein
MKVFECDHCGNLVFFENIKCVKCEHALGFLPEVLELTALDSKPGEAWQALTPLAQGQVFRKCDNTQYQVCNWLMPISDQGLCVASSLNKTIPDLSVPENLARWTKLELAKHHLVYTLQQMGLPLDGVQAEKRHALQFDFLVDPTREAPVLTGHEDGLITMNIAEADGAERERRRVNLHEPYRTLLGHFRYEVGHYYWDRLIASTAYLAHFRDCSAMKRRTKREP